MSNEKDRENEEIKDDGTYLTEDEKVVIVEDGKPVRSYDVNGLGWMFDLFG